MCCSYCLCPSATGLIDLKSLINAVLIGASNRFKDRAFVIRLICDRDRNTKGPTGQWAPSCGTHSSAPAARQYPTMIHMEDLRKHVRPTNTVSTGAHASHTVPGVPGGP